MKPIKLKSLSPEIQARLTGITDAQVQRPDIIAKKPVETLPILKRDRYEDVTGLTTGDGTFTFLKRGKEGGKFEQTDEMTTAQKWSVIVLIALGVMLKALGGGKH